MRYVRELRNVARWMAIAGRKLPPGELVAQLEEVLSGNDGPAPSAPRQAVPSPVRRQAPPAAARRKHRKPSEVGEEELLEALRKHRFELKATAAELGVSRTNFYRMVEECPAVRKAQDLGRDEIDEALARCGGDPEAAVELEVSLWGLKRRMATLGRR